MDWLLDQLLPSYDFRTRYTRQIAAPPDAVWDALMSVTAEELPVTRRLMSIRSAGRARLSGPLMDVAPMPELGCDDGRETVRGRIAKFWQPRPTAGPDDADFADFDEPGWTRAAMSLQLTPTSTGTHLAAETRVKATDRTAWRRFAPYWLLIRLGGAGIIRHELLHAIAHRAEHSPAQHDNTPDGRPHDRRAPEDRAPVDSAPEDRAEGRRAEGGRAEGSRVRDRRAEARRTEARRAGVRWV